ncbi:hypothetical protein K461DRAFT_247449 [Myriangium duriaei CBS 260.36]|uniref:PA14 domain-containing protein n=1 Tax=Myriangium duriaei CBS 260.36 TaxID=1168546 RepID=A0A9P4IUS4_9PEZI|nr:hypothetical protein K461DRAFT_247449 [Myriangium duriaei CBS 260.36]
MYGVPSLSFTEHHQPDNLNSLWQPSIMAPLFTFSYAFGLIAGTSSVLASRTGSIKSSANAHAVLKPYVPDAIDMTDIGLLKPANTSGVYYAGQVMGSDPVTVAKVSVNLKHKSINLDHSAHVNTVTCNNAQTSMAIVFTNNTWYSHAAPMWKKSGNLIFITTSPSCEKDGQSAFFSAQSLVLDPKTNTITAIGGLTTVHDSYSTMKIDFGHIDTNSLSKNKAINISRRRVLPLIDLSYSKSLTIPMNIAPPTSSLVTSPWGNQFPLYSYKPKSKRLVKQRGVVAKAGNPSKAVAVSPNTKAALGLDLFCVNCGITGSFTMTGTLSVGFSGLSDASFVMNGQLNAGMFIGLNAQAAYKNSFTKTINSNPSTTVSIPSILTIAPQLSLGAAINFDVKGAGQALVGGSLSWPSMVATLDFVQTAKSGVTGFKPNFVKTFSATASAAMNADLSLPVSLSVSLNILSGKVKQTIALNETPKLTAAVSFNGDTSSGKAGLNGGSGCVGFPYNVGIYNELDFTYGSTTKTLNSINSPTAASGCLGKGGLASTSSSGIAQTPAPTTSSPGSVSTGASGVSSGSSGASSGSSGSSAGGSPSSGTSDSSSDGSASTGSAGSSDSSSGTVASGSSSTSTGSSSDPASGSASGGSASSGSTGSSDSSSGTAASGSSSGSGSGSSSSAPGSASGSTTGSPGGSGSGSGATAGTISGTSGSSSGSSGSSSGSSTGSSGSISGTSGTSPILPAGTIVPDWTCQNQGLQWAYFVNVQAEDTSLQYLNFNPTIYRMQAPYYTAVSSVVGGLQGGTGLVPSLSIYGSPQLPEFDFAIAHRGYLYAPQTGNYTFTVPAGDDLTLIWVGSAAYSGWKRNNANIVNMGQNHAAKSFSFIATAGTYTPIRIMFADSMEKIQFTPSLTAPDGSVLLDSQSDFSSYIIQQSCDGLTAPAFAAWGSEGIPAWQPPVVGAAAPAPSTTSTTTTTSVQSTTTMSTTSPQVSTMVVGQTTKADNTTTTAPSTTLVTTTPFATTTTTVADAVTSTVPSSSTTSSPTTSSPVPTTTTTTTPPPAPTCASTGQNLLTNGGFDTGDLTGWSTSTYGAWPGPQFIRVVQDSYAGGWAFEMQNGAKSTSILAQTFSGLIPGVTYTFSYEYKSNSNAASSIECVSSDGSLFQESITGGLSSSQLNVWQSASATFTATSTSTTLSCYLGGVAGQNFFVDSMNISC